MRRLLRTYIRILAIVLAINMATNYTDFKNGSMDWKISFLYSAVSVSLGFLAFISLSRLYLNKWLDWKLQPEKSFLIFILCCAGTGAVIEATVLKVKTYISGLPTLSGKDYFNDLAFTAILFITVAMTTTFRTFIDRWKESINQTARVEQLLLKSELESLKNQVNPHFLFNAFNTLTSLIRENEDQAVGFVQQLSKIFRYSLEKKEESTTSLQNELKITQAYLQIFKQRYGDKLHYDIAIPEELLQKQVVGHSLIMLVENATKHNEISTDSPLHIRIYHTNNYIVLENNRQPRKMPFPSNHIGLENMQKRYALVTSLPVLTEATTAIWAVKIPII